MQVSESAERLVKLRAIVAIVLSILLIVTQGQRMSDAGDNLLSWAVWGVVVLVFFIWAAGLLRSRAVRILANDESSELHRRRALETGFWVMLAAAATCFALSFVKSFPPRDAIQVIVTCGIAAALLNFGVSERQGMRSASDNSRS